MTCCRLGGIHCRLDFTESASMITNITLAMTHSENTVQTTSNRDTLSDLAKSRKCVKLFELIFIEYMCMIGDYFIQYSALCQTRYDSCYLGNVRTTSTFLQVLMRQNGMQRKHPYSGKDRKRIDSQDWTLALDLSGLAGLTMQELDTQHDAQPGHIVPTTGQSVAVPHLSECSALQPEVRWCQWRHYEV